MLVGGKYNGFVLAPRELFFPYHIGINARMLFASTFRFRVNLLACGFVDDPDLLDHLDALTSRL